jgi:hypothetical protein
MDHEYQAFTINAAMERLDRALYHAGVAQGISPEILITGHLLTQKQQLRESQGRWTFPLKESITP